MIEGKILADLWAFVNKTAGIPCLCGSNFLRVRIGMAQLDDRNLRQGQNEVTTLFQVSRVLFHDGGGILPGEN